MNVFRTFAAAVLFVAGTVFPAGAAVTQGLAPGVVLDKAITYKTALTPDLHGAGEYDGLLTLTVASDGVVNGYFRQDGAARITDVTGGFDGRRIWLSLGQAGLSHIEGTYDGPSIVAGTYIRGQNYTFRAIPPNS